MQDPSSRAFTSKATSLEVEDDSANLDELPTYQRLALRMAGEMLTVSAKSVETGGSNHFLMSLESLSKDVLYRLIQL